MNFETYNLLKKFLDNGTFTGADAFYAERACQKFEEAQEARKFSLFFTVRPARNILVPPFRGIAISFAGLIES